MRTNYAVVSVFLWKAWSFLKWSPSQETDCQILHHMERVEKLCKRKFTKGDIVIRAWIADF